MADEQIGIEIEIKGSQKTLKSVKDLKDAVKELEKTASEADYGSDEYLKATKSAEDLKKKMAELSGDATKKLSQSLNDLKRQYKELKVALSEASDPNEFKRLSAELNDVEGKIGDMNDAASLAVGSGVEQLQKSIGLVGEGLRNFDFEKVKIGFKGIGNAMSAAAPFALIAAIGFLIENFAAVVDFVKTATGTWSDEEKAVKRATKAYEAQTKVTTELVTQYDNELKILEAQGKSEGKILEVKKLKIAAQIQQLKASVAVQEATINEIKANDDLSESLGTATAWIQRKLGDEKAAEVFENLVQVEKLERIKEEQAKKDEALRAISSLEADLVVLQINNDKKIVESAKKSSEDKKKQAEIDGEARYQAWKAEQERMANEEAIIIPEQKEAITQTELEINAAKNAELLNQSALLYEKDKELAKKAAEDKAKGIQVIEKLSLDAAKGLSDAVFAYQLSNVKKGSAQELELRKKQFNLDKAFSLAKAGMDGTKAVLSTFADTPGGLVIKSIAASLAGSIALTNITKIASAKFEGGASSGSVSAPSVGSGSTNLPTPPTIQQSNTTTQFDNQGNNLGQSNQRQVIDITGKVSVSQNDIEEKQKRADRLKVQTTF